MAKKSTKTETPIDQRETFVSIQKSFADSGISIEEKLNTLFELQKADTEIDKLVQLRGELPGEVAALEEEIAVLKEKAAQQAALIDAYNRGIAEYKQGIVEDMDAIARYQKQLEGIQNSREYGSLSKEIENQELERQIKDKKIGELRYQIEETTASLDALKDRISIRNEDLEVKKQELAQIVESTAKDEEAFKAKREKCAAKIDPRTMSAYERIRASVHNHLAVVSIFNENACGGCFNTITPQRIVEINAHKKLVICEHCGRILI